MKPWQVDRSQWLAVFFFAAILFLHAWHITSLPRGLYIDEASIGYNAALIAENLHDEHGISTPVYFKAFGEYKNPLYIYTAAILFKSFGVNLFLLRFTSIVFFALFLLGFYFLAKSLFPKQQAVHFYALLAAGTIPWLFNTSRVAFEVITQPAVFIWFLYFVFQTYHIRYSKSLALITGLLAGLSLYTYTTSRLLTFTTILLFFCVYYKKSYWRLHIYFLIGFLLLLIPYTLFAFNHSGALSENFKHQSFLYNSSLVLKTKLYFLVNNYLSYFSPGFLLIHGDYNKRHNIGYGEFYIIAFILALMGILYVLSSRLAKEKRFELLLLLNLLAAPLAAALLGRSYSLRSILLGVYLLCLSLYGLAVISKIANKKWQIGLTIGVYLLLSVQACMYFIKYFCHYPKVSIQAFENYDFAKVLQEATAQNSSQIIIDNSGEPIYVELEFFRLALKLPNNFHFTYGAPIPQPHTCIIYLAKKPISTISDFKISFEDIQNFSQLKCFATSAIPGQRH